eukprot:m.16495 g.16495  ORF g.16495 m.16495 type:complete len:917 (-) comp5714_c0_seq1:599-3349(-)
MRTIFRMNWSLFPFLLAAVQVQAKLARRTQQDALSQRQENGFQTTTDSTLCAASDRGCGHFAFGATCNCDVNCHIYNDCCEDFESVCPEMVATEEETTLQTAASTKSSTVTCAGRCGDAWDPQYTCFCNKDCVSFEDCCTDFISQCPSEASKVLTTTQDPCALCSTVADPVCVTVGSVSNEYLNECTALCHGFTDSTAGPCPLPCPATLLGFFTLEEKTRAKPYTYNLIMEVVTLEACSRICFNAAKCAGFAHNSQSSWCELIDINLIANGINLDTKFNWNVYMKEMFECEGSLPEDGILPGPLTVTTTITTSVSTTGTSTAESTETTTLTSTPISTTTSSPTETSTSVVASETTNSRTTASSQTLTVEKQFRGPITTTAVTSASCLDAPLGWHDSDDDNCATYETYQWCTPEGGYGRYWGSPDQTFEQFSFDGVSAVQACCACGGGSAYVAPTPAEGAKCRDEPSNWFDSDGYNCEQYVSLGWCAKDGSFGRNWGDASVAFSVFASSGVHAGMACCGCGGGEFSVPVKADETSTDPISSSSAMSTASTARQTTATNTPNARVSPGSDTNASTDQGLSSVTVFGIALLVCCIIIGVVLIAVVRRSPKERAKELDIQGDFAEAFNTLASRSTRRPIFYGNGVSMGSPSSYASPTNGWSHWGTTNTMNIGSGTMKSPKSAKSTPTGPRVRFADDFRVEQMSPGEDSTYDLATPTPKAQGKEMYLPSPSGAIYDCASPNPKSHTAEEPVYERLGIDTANSSTSSLEDQARIPEDIALLRRTGLTPLGSGGEARGSVVLPYEEQLAGKTPEKGMMTLDELNQSKMRGARNSSAPFEIDITEDTYDSATIVNDINETTKRLSELRTDYYTNASPATGDSTYDIHTVPSLTPTAQRRVSSLRENLQSQMGLLDLLNNKDQSK